VERPRQTTREEIKARLGISQLPETRYDAPDPGESPAAVKLWKALKCVDVIETCAFERYIPPRIVIDQTMDPYSLSTENTWAAAVRTDVPIPSHVKIERICGIGATPNAHHHYIWLAQIFGQHWDELGPVGSSRPLVWRTNGYEGSKPFLGLIFKLDFSPGDRLNVGANWALMMDKPAPVLPD
jgi:hypothetical protein